MQFVNYLSRPNSKEDRDAILRYLILTGEDKYEQKPMRIIYSEQKVEPIGWKERVDILCKWSEEKRFDSEYKKELEQMIIQTEGTVGGRPRIVGRRIEPEQVVYMVSENLHSSKDPYINDLELTSKEIDACVLYATTHSKGKWIYNR